MAKKKEIVRLRVICEEGEECWVEYPAFLSSEHGVNLAKPKGWPATWAIRRRGDFCYVQGEDAHTVIEVQLENNGLAPRYTQHDVANFRAWLASDHWPMVVPADREAVAPSLLGIFKKLEREKISARVAQANIYLNKKRQLKKGKK